MAHVPAQERRKQFVEAASRVISEKGVSGATTRAIAQEAGAALASLHYVFNSKEDLLVELVRWAADFNQNVIAETPLPAGSGVATAARTILLMWRSVERPLVFSQFDILLWSMRTELTKNESVLLYERMVEQFGNLLEHAATPKERKSLDFKRLAVRLIVICDGVQFGTLCAGPDYISDAEVVDMFDSVIKTAVKT
ncbi:TetR/AcrR family transcriptional regulator [Paraburkholderia tropica]|uniref:TetR/AcrR family transcriptional regulator n=1 Tax=Paraburkholderia tropica TaxID=92647 RepID=UPI001591036C|nr:TetR/AcrR family transcriptional regulator [Paraburkholderia tropica]